MSKIVIIAGNLEGVGHSLIEALGIDDARSEVSFTTLMRKIQRRLRAAGVPSCAQGDHKKLQAEIYRWCDAAISAMDSRHPVMHAHYYFRVNDELRLVATRQHIKPGTQYSIDLTEFDAAWNRLETVTQWGQRLHHPLLHAMPEGGAGNHYVQREVVDANQQFFAGTRERTIPRTPGSSRSRPLGQALSS